MMISQSILYICRTFCLLGALTWFAPASAAGMKILLDPGHSPTSGQQGALGMRGVYEVTYNDQFAARLVKALQVASVEVRLSRQPYQNMGLEERARAANDWRPDLFLSLHHDSAQPVHLKAVPLLNQAGQQGGEIIQVYQTTQPIAGYSIFVSMRNADFPDSYRFAQLLGQSLLKLRRPPNLYHAGDIAGERRELLNTTLGIYRYDNLAVLAKTQVPAVLLEIGVIVDPADERYVSDERHQDALCRAIVSAVLAYAQHRQ